MIVVVRVLQTASIASVSNAHRAFRLQYGKDCHRRAVYAFQHCSPVSHYARNGAPGLHWRQACERESKPTQSKSSRAPCVSIHRLHSMDWLCVDNVDAAIVSASSVPLFPSCWTLTDTGYCNCSVPPMLPLPPPLSTTVSNKSKQWQTVRRAFIGVAV